MIKVLIKATGKVERITMKMYIADRSLYTKDFKWKKAVKKTKPAKKVTEGE